MLLLIPAPFVSSYLHIGNGIGSVFATLVFWEKTFTPLYILSENGMKHSFTAMHFGQAVFNLCPQHCSL